MGAHLKAADKHQLAGLTELDHIKLFQPTELQGQSSILNVVHPQDILV